MAALSPASESATLIAFPGAASGQSACLIAAALKAHRLPELLAAQLVRGAAGAAHPELGLAQALGARMRLEPLDLARTKGILLIGAAGAGKEMAAAAIVAATARQTVTIPAREGLNRLKTESLPPDALVVMETDDFHPLNPRARGAFAALSDIEELEAVGIVSATGDAEEVAETIAAFRFKRIIVTGLDRTRRLGALVAAVTSGARLAHVVREERLETPDSHALAAALLAPRPHA